MPIITDKTDFRVPLPKSNHRDYGLTGTAVVQLNYEQLKTQETSTLNFSYMNKCPEINRQYVT